jgi:cysteinyl-tRNA synthetase
VTETSAAPGGVVRLAEERQAARKVRNWAESDRLRDAIAAQGFVVEDTPQGFRLKPRP